MLGVARTLTSATRLLDVLALLRPEDGIEVAYTVNPGSTFAAVRGGRPRALRGGHLLEAHAVRPWGHPRPRLDALLLGCAVNLWWLAETSRDPVADAVGSGLRVRTGERVLRVEFTQRRV